MRNKATREFVVFGNKQFSSTETETRRINSTRTINQQSGRLDVAVAPFWRLRSREQTHFRSDDRGFRHVSRTVGRGAWRERVMRVETGRETR